MTSAAFLAAIAVHSIAFCSPDIPWDLSAHGRSIGLVGLNSSTECVLDTKNSTFDCPHGDRISIAGDGHQVTVTWPGISSPIIMKNVSDTSECQ